MTALASIMKIRFLQDEIEREVESSAVAIQAAAAHGFQFPPIDGVVEIESRTSCKAALTRLTVRIVEHWAPAGSMLSTHTLLGVQRWRFRLASRSAEEYREAARCLPQHRHLASARGARRRAAADAFLADHSLRLPPDRAGERGRFLRRYRNRRDAHSARSDSERRGETANCATAGDRGRADSRTHGNTPARTVREDARGDSQSCAKRRSSSSAKATGFGFGRGRKPISSISRSMEKSRLSNPWSAILKTGCISP